MKKSSSNKKKITPSKTAARAKPATKHTPTLTKKVSPRASKKKVSLPRLRQTPIPIDPASHPFTLPSFLSKPVVPYVPEFESLGELPESYGTRRLFLTARDPQTLFAYWDFTRDQLLEAEREASDGKIYLQVFSPGKERVHQIHISPGSREWFLPTQRPATPFQAELGYYRSNGSFHQLALSPEITSPPDSPSANETVEFVTIPFHFSFRQLWDLVREFLRPGEALAQILARLKRTGHPLPFPYALRRSIGSLSTAKIFSYLGGDLWKYHRSGSLEMTEILRRQIDTCPKLGSSQLHGTSPGNPPRST